MTFKQTVERANDLSEILDKSSIVANGNPGIFVVLSHWYVGVILQQQIFFSGSVEIPSSEMICQRYDSDCLKSSEGFSSNPFPAIFWNTLSKRWKCFSIVFEKNQYIIEKNQTFFQMKFPHTFLIESLKSCWIISKSKNTFYYIRRIQNYLPTTQFCV